MVKIQARDQASGASKLALGAALVTVTLLIIIDIAQTAHSAKRHQNMERKSIVFDMKTPKVFYCPQEKPVDPEKLIVKARPLEKLCEFNGQQKPRNQPSDCFNDVDETEFACDEKRRLMIKMDLVGDYEPIEPIDDLEYILTKTSGKKRASHIAKKH